MKAGRDMEEHKIYPRFGEEYLETGFFGLYS